MLQIDGSQGEGGGQVLRTCLSLSALLGRPFHLTNIRAGRRKPGLRPQHLTAVRAAAAICDARLQGAELNSQTVEFHPRYRPRGGVYQFDVSEASRGGSAGSVTLVLQAILWPLVYADSPATITLEGGTHVPFSPPFHHLAHVARPAFVELGASFEVELVEWGWYPRGGGRVTLQILPCQRLRSADFTTPVVDEVNGIAAVTNLPSHIPQRMSGRVRNLLAEAGLRSTVQVLRETGRGPGAGIVLWVKQGGFTSLGRRGLPAEKVAETAVEELWTFLASGTAVDKHLADQLLLPLALADGRSTYTTHELTRHTLTNIDLLRTWLNASIQVEGELNRSARITVDGVGLGTPGDVL